MTCALKKNVPDLYMQYRLFLWGGSLSLSIPLLARFILDLLSNYDTNWYDWLYNAKHDDRVASYNLVSFLFTTYLPIVSQLTSLMFGAIRKSHAKEVQAEDKDLVYDKAD